jgi:hypothetical protein
MGTITQHIEQDGTSWFEYSTKTFTLINFTLSELIKRVVQIDPTLN